MRNEDRKALVLGGWPWVALLAGILLSATIQLLAFWPGILTWDAIRQYRQALSGQYDDWHPPAMSWLWRQLLPLHAGPAPMLVLQAVLTWGGIGLIAATAPRRGRPWAAAGIVACGLLPIPFTLVGTILKDSLMAGLLLVAAGLTMLRPTGRGSVPARIAAGALLLAAATLRFNAAPACLPLALALLPPRWIATRARLGVAAILTLLPLLAAMPLANVLLRAERSGVELSLVTFDLAGITRYSGVDAFPPLPVADPVAVNAGCYRSVSWDRYAWWGPEPCAIQFADVRAALAANGGSAYGWWARAIAAHPLAYARHRLGHFSSTTRFLVHDADEPTLSLRSDPNPWNYTVAERPALSWIGRLAAWSVATPLGWPIVWLALGAGLLTLGRDRLGPAWPMLLSALLYGASYLPLSVASEVRYYAWCMTAIAIAAVFALEGIATGAPLPRRRLLLAILPAAAVTMLCIAARA